MFNEPCWEFRMIPGWYQLSEESLISYYKGCVQTFEGSQRVSRVESSNDEDWPVKIRVQVIIS